MPTPINNTPNKVIDLNLPIEKQAFRFGQDDNRIVWINTSDLGFVERLPISYEKLTELQGKVAEVTDGVNKDAEEVDDVMSSLATLGSRLKALDAEMREVIDELFQAPVSAAAAPDGSMYDLYNGSPRYEIIITALIEQFGTRYTDEFKKVKEKVNQRTAKYRGKK